MKSRLKYVGVFALGCLITGFLFGFVKPVNVYESIGLAWVITCVVFGSFAAIFAICWAAWVGYHLFIEGCDSVKFAFNESEIWGKR